MGVEAEVAISAILPCDLPLWPKAQELLVSLQSSTTMDQVADCMIKLHALCNVASDVNFKEDESEFEREIRIFQFIVENQFTAEERERFMSRTLPCMARFAVSLAELRPTTYKEDLEGVSLRLSKPLAPSSKRRSLPASKICKQVNLDRRFVASIAANAFFSTLPRTSAQELGLQMRHERVSFHVLFDSLHCSVDQAFRWEEAGGKKGKRKSYAVKFVLSG